MLIARRECDQRHAPPEPTAPADFADFSARPSFEPAPYRQKSLNGAAPSIHRHRHRHRRWRARCTYVA
jgi:hypothetical protein